MKPITISRIFCVALFLLCLASGLRAQNFDIIDSFEAQEQPDGSYKFCPTCWSSPTPPAGEVAHPCSATELACFFFEWQFSETDVSTKPQPVRRFNALPVTVFMRYTGIKEERVGNCIVKGLYDDDCRVHTAMPPSAWFRGDRSRTFTMLELDRTPILADEHMTDCINDDTVPSIGIGAPFGKPLWGAKMVYPVSVINRSGTTRIFHVLLTNSLVRRSGGSRQYFPLGLRTVPVIDPSITTTETSSGLIFCGTVVANSSKTFLFEANLPAQDEKNPWNENNHLLEARPYYGDVPSLCNCFSKQLDGVCYNELRCTKNDTVFTSIDPNFKHIEHRKHAYLPGDWVTYSVHFQNVGNMDEKLVYVADLLDNRFDGAKAKFLTGKVYKRGNPKAFRITPVVNTIKQVHNDGQLFWIEFEDNVHVLGPGDSGVVTFQVQIKPASEFSSSINLPDWLTTTHRRLVEVPNSAYTMFGGEGISYEARCSPGVFVEVEHEVPSVLFWVLLAIIILVVIAVAVWLWRIRSTLAVAFSPSNPPVGVTS